MRRALTNTKRTSKAKREETLARRGSGSSSLARIRFFASLCALPLISIFALWVTAPASAATWPVPASALSASVAFHQSYSAGIHSYVHSGIDIPAPAGMQVSSPVAGTVRFTGAVPSGDSRTSSGADARTTMNAVSVQMPGGKTVTLMPLDSIAVQEGDAVPEGARLGSVAASGDVSSADAHLHLGYKEGSRYLDPMLLFGAQPAPAPDAAGERAAATAGVWGGLLDPQLPLAQALEGAAAADPALESQPQAAPDASAQLPAESFGSIETGSYALKTKAAAQDAPFDAALSALCSLGVSCLAQAGALLDALAGLARATALPLPLLVGIASALALAGVVALGVVGVRFLAPRMHRALHASKRFLVFAERGW